MRAYVGLQPPVAFRERLSQELTAIDSRRGAGWVNSDHFHVTLRFLGDVDTDSPAFERLRTAYAVAPARVVRLGGVLQMLGDAVVVPATGTDDLAQLARALTATGGEVTEPAEFFGHMTLALPSADQKQWADEVVGTPFTTDWRATEAFLFASDPSAASRYRVLTRFPLA